MVPGCSSVASTRSTATSARTRRVSSSNDHFFETVAHLHQTGCGGLTEQIPHQGLDPQCMFTPVMCFNRPGSDDHSHSDHPEDQATLAVDGYCRVVGGRGVRYAYIVEEVLRRLYERCIDIAESREYRRTLQSRSEDRSPAICMPFVCVRFARIGFLGFEGVKPALQISAAYSDTYKYQIGSILP